MAGQEPQSDLAGELARGILYSVILVVGLWVAFGLFTYGTVSPCGMVAKEANARLMKQAIQSGGDATEKGSRILGYQMASGAIEDMARSQGPWRCTKILWRIKVEGEDPLGGDRFAP